MTYRKSLFYATSDVIRKARPSFRKTRTLQQLHEAPPDPIWSCGAVEKQPDIRLHNWSAIDAANIGRPQQASTTHVIGNAANSDGFCLSSEICLLDPRTQRAMARNGTVYELVDDAAPDSAAAHRFAHWAREQLLHTINSTRMLVHALAIEKPTVVHTIALATARDTLPVEIGRISVTRSGSACDAVFQGTPWSNELRTLRISDSIQEEEPICSLLVRLLEQVEVGERVCAMAPTDYFKLSVHIGTTAQYALEIESLETTPDMFGGGHRLKYLDMHGRGTSYDVPGNTVSPLGFITSTFPSMWKELTDYLDMQRKASTAHPSLEEDEEDLEL